MISHENLQKILPQISTIETSSNPEKWTEENPLLGHCAIVALIVQDEFGGDLLRASLEETEFAYMRSHYWNLLPDGSEIDLSESQFEGRRPVLSGEVRTREYVLGNQATKERYMAFKRRLLLDLEGKN